MRASQEEVDAIMAKVYAGGTVTREEGEAVVRHHDRWCAGPIKPGHEAEYAGLAAELVAQGPAGGEAIASIVQMNAMLRDYCGYDVNELVLLHQFDGAYHEEPCPKCGTIIDFSSPVFPMAA